MTKLDQELASMDTTDLEDFAAEDAVTDEVVALEAEPAKALSKADKLEAKAAKLRAAEAERAERVARQTATGGNVRPWQVATGVLAMLLAVALGVGIPYALRSHHDTSSSAPAAAPAADVVHSGPSAAAVQAATTAATDFASYDYRHVGTDMTRTLNHLTPQFRKSYATVAAKLKPYIVQYHGVATAKVQGIGVESASASKVVVLVFLDQSVTTKQSSTATINRNRGVVTMVKQAGGGWLVGGFQLR